MKKKIFAVILCLVMLFTSLAFFAACTPDGNSNNNSNNNNITDNNSNNNNSNNNNNNDSNKPAANFASTVISSLFSKPEPWDFLPDSFEKAKMESSAAAGIDYSQNFVQVSAIPTKRMGKQMNVMYSTLLTFDKYLSYLEKAISATTTVADLYQAFVNKNPDNYKQFSGSAADFTFTITLTDNNYSIVLTYSDKASMKIGYDKTAKKTSGKLQLLDANAIKYEITPDKLKVAVKLVNVSLTQIDFERGSGVVNGSMYEFFGTEEHNIKTSAMIRIDDQYTAIISNKRETEDLKIEGDVELYSNVTGKFLLSEVHETVGVNDYDTFWFNLADVTGIDSVKVIPEMNGTNNDTIYINGNSSPIKTDLNITSRKFDIEMKDVYVYVRGEDGKLDKQKISIPMLFVQEKNLDTFAKDFYDANKNTGMSAQPTLTTSLADIAKLTSLYNSLLDQYLAMKNVTTYATVKNYVES